MAKIIDATGALAEVPFTMDTYQAASEAGLSVRQYINQTYPTRAEEGSAFSQILASEGIFFASDAANGIQSTKLNAILDGSSSLSAGPVTRDGVPTSRIVWPAAIMSAVEDKLVADLTMSANAFSNMIAIEESIQGDKFDRPVLNFSKPEAARSNGITQLAAPNSMMTVTVSDVSRRIPTFALGMEVADQATQNVSIDLIALGMARQIAAERAERADGYLLSMLQGDVDNGMAALSTIPGKVVNAKVYDAALTVAGTLSQTAWMAWLIKNGRKRRITHVITDLAGALAIENRTGKPTVMTDNPTSTRINTLHNVMNPTWGNEVQVYITEDPNWPANTILGLDKSSAMIRVKSLSADYSATEAYVMKRSSAMRVDFGEIVYRLFDDAFETLTMLG